MLQSLVPCHPGPLCPLDLRSPHGRLSRPSIAQRPFTRPMSSAQPFDSSLWLLLKREPPLHLTHANPLTMTYCPSPPYAPPSSASPPCCDPVSMLPQSLRCHLPALLSTLLCRLWLSAPSLPCVSRVLARCQGGLDCWLLVSWVSVG